MKTILCVLTAVLMATVTQAQVPQSAHVVVVLEENHSYSSIKGSSSMPYLNSLAAKYGLAVNYYGNTHPSIGNYFMLSTGSIITNSDGYSSNVSANNMVRAMISAGVTWKSYAESLPSAGYTGGDKYPYVKHHNPFAYFTDVVNSSSEKLNIVPFTQFSKDLANGTLPQFSFIVPNMHHNMHDCPDGMSSCTDSQKKAAADSWLKTNIAPLLSNPQFQTDGVLIITFDEGSSSDTSHGGGHVFTAVIGPKVKSAYQSTTFYQHQSLLRTMLASLGVTANLPGASASAPLMSDMFVSTATPPPPPPPPTGPCTASGAIPSVTICTPTAGTSSGSPVQVTAVAQSSSTVTVSSVWVDGVKQYQVYSSQVDTSVAMTPGTHRLTVQSKDSAGVTFKSTIYMTAN